MASRKSKLIKVVSVYLVLIALIFITSTVQSNIELNDYQGFISSTTKVENYIGQFFEAGWIIVGLGCLFALIWAGRLQNQVRHAKWFRNAIIIDFILTLLFIPVNISISRIDCSNDCVWYILPQSTAYILGLLSAIFWFGVSIVLYKFMLRNSSSPITPHPQQPPPQLDKAAHTENSVNPDSNQVP
jgi:cytochrome c oxidase subunit IV